VCDTTCSATIWHCKRPWAAQVRQLASVSC
jgi:hypothetical protein